VADHSGQGQLIDVRDVTDIVREAAAVASGNEDIEIRDPKHAARFLVEYATDHGPTLFHFDEVGADPLHSLFDLRQLAVAVWARMHAIKTKDGGDAMPRVYFLVTGRSTEPFQEVDTGSAESPCGSYFLVLGMLSAEHVGDVRKHVMSSRITHPVVLVGLNETRHGQYLDECLARATGGAPRLLLYTLRALHHLQLPLDSEEAIALAVNDNVFTLLNNIPIVSREFRPSRSDATESSFFRMLLAFHIHRHRVQHDTSVKIGSTNTKIGRMLRFQPFLLSRGGSTSSDQFVLHLPLYHLKSSAAEFGADAVPMLLIAMAGADVIANEPWRIFEMYNPHSQQLKLGRFVRPHWHIIGQDAALRHALHTGVLTPPLLAFRSDRKLRFYVTTWRKHHQQQQLPSSQKRPTSS
jgi:hypothetical protein